MENPSVEALLLEKLSQRLSGFPGYARIRRAAGSLEPWTLGNGMLTPTLKLNRRVIAENWKGTIERLYEGHG